MARAALSISCNIILLISIITPVILVFILKDHQLLTMLRVLNYVGVANFVVLTFVPLFTKDKSALGADVTWYDILPFARFLAYNSLDRPDVTLQQFLRGDIL